MLASVLILITMILPSIRKKKTEAFEGDSPP
jgi:hypothetical protein